MIRQSNDSIAEKSINASICEMAPEFTLSGAVEKASARAFRQRAEHKPMVVG
jgi:hypothetical protein